MLITHWSISLSKKKKKSFWNLNEQKTQVEVFGPPDPHSSSKGGSFKFDKQIKAVNKAVDKQIRASFFKLRFLTNAKPFLFFAGFEKAFHVFILSRVDT